MKSLTAIDRYIFKATLVPMISVFVIAASLLVLDKMLRLFDFVAVEGGPVSVVFKMLANLLPEYASLAIPLGLLLGILLAFRKLATSSELDVMRAVGLGYTRLLRVPYAIALVLAFIKDPPRAENPHAGRSSLQELMDVLRIPGIWPIMPIVFLTYAMVAAERS